MAFKFPFSTLHELNLDWILEKVKTFAELIPPMETAVEDVQSLSTDVQQAVEDAQQALEDAGEAIQTAEEAKEIAEQAAQGTIADGAVTTAKLADGAVTTAKIADGAVTGNKIGTATIQTGNLSEGCITTTQILDGTVGTVDLHDGAITTVKIDDEAVTTSKIDDAAITMAKLSTEVQDAINKSTITDNISPLIMQSIRDNVVIIDVHGAANMPSGTATTIATITNYKPHNHVYNVGSPGGSTNKYLLLSVQTNGEIIAYNYTGEAQSYIFGELVYII